MAAASPLVKAEAVSIPDFFELGRKHQVFIVPKVWINEKVFVDGSPPEKTMMRAIDQALDPDAPAGALR